MTVLLRRLAIRRVVSAHQRCFSTAGKKDPYNVMGLSPAASQKEIKEKFRELAKKYHPDRNPNDPEAQGRMATLTDAYAILTDPKKRSILDREQREMRNGSSTFLSVPYLIIAGRNVRQVFGRQAKYRQAGQVSQRGDDITTEIEVSFMEAMRGSTRTVALSCRQGCDTCNGSGAAPGTGWTMCRQCKGTGTVRVERGIMTMGMPCNTCSGSGQTLDHPCRSCRGEGAMVRRKDVLVSVPAGARQFTELRLPGLGHCGLRGGRNGDLFVTIKVKEHERFRRVDEDVHLTVPVTLSQALLGGTVEIPSLTSEKDIIRLQIPPNTLPGNSRIIRGKGPPKLSAGSSTDSSSNPRGNLVLHFSLSLPERLTPRQEALIREFDDIERESKEKRSSRNSDEGATEKRSASATAE
ncbi:chaperone protein DNAJ, putative [Perkinsus marinus ATCC 50983]|uniref:Chaperone protein DNAJ, putative n=1 Tax=Perkinsus marinus (strain ATCC 50983 / TXsc) TaxID=423536 RepID=C5LNN4_PERM5|nr:chaperone protein DNAJ, putative [Perkinsus marinus ATCC 50983]EER01653.1 chaperone protein DNAJ, putative [Perkinsus marinus ATCC 50983]|eukprot:XP_002768935.1 chaperone protein DNAJ, putative [Perkinsus marinus ATCC 50983]